MKLSILTCNIFGVSRFSSFQWERGTPLHPNRPPTSEVGLIPYQIELGSPSNLILHCLVSTPAKTGASTFFPSQVQERKVSSTVGSTRPCH